MKILHQWKGLNGSMKSALNKDFIRDILKSKGRFLSIVTIVALGVAFFIGVKSSPIVMKTASDKYYDDNNLMDIRLLSSMGLTDDGVCGNRHRYGKCKGRSQAEGRSGDRAY